VRRKNTGEILAAKVCKKSDIISKSSAVLEQELLTNIDHPFVVKLHGAFQTRHHLCFLFDFLSSGELFYHLRKRPELCFDEATARFYIAELGCAIGYLHKRNIVHRDIKAENLVLDNNGHVVLTDFGFALLMHAQRNETLQCGTLSYVAPEVLNPPPGGYSSAVDWWSLGVVLFVMLTGCYPFLRQQTRDTMKAIMTQPLMFPSKPPLSKEATDLVSKLLEKDPSQRLSNVYAFQAHPFFATLDWAALERKELNPPFVPDSHGRNTKYFEDALTNEPVTQSKVFTIEQLQGVDPLVPPDDMTSEEIRRVSLKDFPTFSLAE
jgi:serine/threonine protein kinase